MELEPKTDLQAVNNALKELSPNVTTTDRAEAPASETTIVRYLKGLGKDLETGIKLLQFFTQRIENRRKLIKDLQS
jgi:hypothetical protein